MSNQLNPKAILLAKLTEEEIGDLANFDCGDEEINNFIKTEALKEQELGMNVTMLMYYEGQLAGFYSICADSIKLDKEEKNDELYLPNIPAIKIARLGRDITFKGRGVGEFLVKHAIHKALEVDEDTCGVRMITLDAYPSRVDYYLALGFKPNEHRNYKGKNRQNISMRLDIYGELF